MAWTPLSPPRLNASSKTVAPVTIAGQVNKLLRKPSLLLVVRVYLLPEPPAFLAPKGKPVRVLLGTGDHAGLIRLEAGGNFAVFAAGGRNQKGAVAMLRLPWPEGVAHAPQDATAVEHDWNATWLEVTLPAWARPAEPMRSMQLASQAAQAARDRLAGPAKGARA